jgi:hypothetical protein
MDPNLVVLLVLLGVALVFGAGAAVFLSERVRKHGVLGALRRAFSGGVDRDPYGR